MFKIFQFLVNSLLANHMAAAQCIKALRRHVDVLGVPNKPANEPMLQ